MIEIICLLDGSGSMSRVRNEALGAFNHFLEEQKIIGDANITIIWFDNNFEVAFEGALQHAEPLPDWMCRGTTALYDAIGKTFAHVRHRFSVEKPEKAIMAIQTDGMENASKEFDQTTVASLIKEHQDSYGWDVIFLGAGLDVAKQATGMGINSANTICYDSRDTANGFDQYTRAVASARSKK